MSSTAEFNSQFEAFAKFGDKKSSGKDISLTQSDKWLKQAKVLGEGEAIPIADAAIYFKAMKQPRLSLAQYLKFLEQLTSRKEGLLDDVKNKMTTCGAPVVRKMKKIGKVAAAVRRLTDSSRYTGTHKLRFNKAGKGKGIKGRKDVSKNDGYVKAYAEKDKYDETH